MIRGAQSTDVRLAADGDAQLAKVIREVIQGVKSVNYGSIEIIIQNSRVVQIERKEKFRFDRD